jgi:hypothetical protein
MKILKQADLLFISRESCYFKKFGTWALCEQKGGSPHGYVCSLIVLRGTTS